MATIRRTFRFSVFVVLAVLPSIFAAAQTAPRVPPTHDNFANRLSIAAPYGETLFNAGEATLEGGEQPHPCAGPVSIGSVWYSLSAPAGVTLNITTSGSNYNTVISVWKTAAVPSLASLVNVACEDDGTGQAELDFPVATSGQYFVSVGNLSAAGAATLSIDFSMTVPAGLLPKGQNPNNPVNLKLNGAVKVAGIEYGVNGFNTVEPPSCNPQAVDYNAWFRVSVPDDTILRISGEGTLLDYPIGASAISTLTVYPVGIYTQAAQEACSAPSGILGAGIIPSVGLETGIWIVRVSAYVAENIPLPSRYKVRTRVFALANLVDNHNFEAVDALEGWKVKNATGDGITIAGGEVLSGLRSFKFVGGTGEKSKLQQTKTLFAPLPVDEDMVFAPTVQYTTTANGEPFTLLLTLYYSDGTTEVLKRRFTTQIGGVAAGAALTPTRAGTVVKFRLALKYAAPTAITIIDNFGLPVNSLVTRGVLPPP